MTVMRTLLFVLLLAAVTFSQSIQEKVSKFEDAKKYFVTYDKFAKETRVVCCSRTFLKSANDSRNTVGFEMEVTLTDVGNPSFLLRLDPGGNRWYEDVPLKFLLDGEPLTLTATSGDVRRYASFALTSDEWKRIASAKKVEMQLRGFETVWDAKVMQAIRNLNSLIVLAP
jgi:hypothetical protein